MCFFCIECDLLCSHNCGQKEPLCCEGYHICLSIMGFMACVCWTARKDEQMHGLAKVTLVRELLEWDIYDTF